MGWIYSLQFYVIVMVLVISSSTCISDGKFWDYSSTGRNLLQQSKSCPINFESQNYTIITSQCKGPSYPAADCCAALKEFACPFVLELNDLTNDCASTMFSYINLSGNYPPGLFANECQEGKEGLACPADAPSQSANASGTLIWRKPSQVLVLAGALVGLLHRFL